MGVIAERVARRALNLRRADEMTPAEWETYKKQHPDADRSKHKIVKVKSQTRKPAPGTPQGKKPPPLPDAAKTKPKPPPLPGATKKSKPPPVPEAAKKPKPPPPLKERPQDHEEHDDHGEGGRFDGWKKSLKGLKDSAVKFVEKSPKALKSFFGDADFRKAALKEAKDAVTSLPKGAKQRLIETVKEEVHEFKLAGAGIKAMISGKKMSKHQKHAFKAVATHLAIGATAAAFAATGPLVGAAVFSKNLATHVALKSVKKALGSLHTMNEVNHIGHGIMHLFEHVASEEGKGKKEINPEEAMTNLIFAAVAKQIEQLTDQDFTTVLNDLDEGDEDKATKSAAINVLNRFRG